MLVHSVTVDNNQSLNQSLTTLLFYLTIKPDKQKTKRRWLAKVFEKFNWGNIITIQNYASNMRKKNYVGVIALFFVLLCLSAIAFEPVHSAIPKPSVPKFTVKLNDPSYDMPTTTSTAPIVAKK